MRCQRRWGDGHQGVVVGWRETAGSVAPRKYRTLPSLQRDYVVAKCQHDIQGTALSAQFRFIKYYLTIT